MWHTLSTACVLLVGLAGQAAAQDGSRVEQSPDAGTLSLEQLLDVEVESVFGASKSLQKTTEAPAAVTVFTAEEIERFGWRTLADLLRNTRGFYVTNDRSYAYVGARGFLRPGDLTTRVLLTIDGRRVNDNVFDQALVEEDFQVDLSTAQRVEIIRGPSSSLYGSSAFLGVVNVVTKPASQGRPVEVTLGAGTLGRGEVTFRARHDFDTGLALSVAGAGVTEDGVGALYYPEYDHADTNNGFAIGLDFVRRKNLFARADYRNLTISGGYNLRRRGMPTGAYETAFNQQAWLDDGHARVDVNLTGSVARGWTGTLRSGYDHYEFTGYYPYDWDGDPATAVVDYMDRASGHWWTAEAQLSRTIRGHEITMGVEYRLNSKQDQFSFIASPYESLWVDTHRSNTFGLYLQDQFRLHERLMLNLGLRQDHYAAFADPLKPRLAAIYNPRLDTTVKFIYGSAFRAPNVFESYYEIPGLWRSGRDLQPEEIRTVEGIVEHYAGKRLRLSGGVFRYAVDRLINFATEPGPDGLVFFDNLDAVHAVGLEAEAEAKWPSGLQGRVSYTFADAKAADTSDALSNSPRHVTQALISVPLPRSLAVSFDAQMLSSRTSRAGQIVAAYVRPNLTINAPLGVGRRVTLSIVNLFDQRYADPVGDDFAQDTVEQNGRTARLYFTWAF